MYEFDRLVKISLFEFDIQMLVFTFPFCVVFVVLLLGDFPKIISFFFPSRLSDHGGVVVETGTQLAVHRFS